MASRPDAASMPPVDLDGPANASDEPPSADTLRKVSGYVVLDRDGKEHKFSSLYSGDGSAARTLVIFVRHFFCGSCQDFLRDLSASISPSDLASLSPAAGIAVVGCGDPGLIATYAQATGCPFPVFADPARGLHGALGMARTLAQGARPAYARRSLPRLVLDGVAQLLAQLPSGLALGGGDPRQVGGDFLFERDAAAPAAARVVWCHRMRTTRDHAEVPVLRRVLGLDGEAA